MGFGLGLGIWDLGIEGEGGEGEIVISEIGVRVRNLGFGNRREREIYGRFVVNCGMALLCIFGKVGGLLV